MIDYVRDKIARKKYHVDTYIDYSKKNREKYREKQSELYEIFKKESLEAVGLDEYNCADKAFSFAWNLGHSYGHYEVFMYLQEIAEVVQWDSDE